MGEIKCLRVNTIPASFLRMRDKWAVQDLLHASTNSKKETMLFSMKNINFSFHEYEVAVLR